MLPIVVFYVYLSTLTRGNYAFKADIRSFEAVIYRLYVDGGGDEISIIVGSGCRNSALNNDAGNYIFWQGNDLRFMTRSRHINLCTKCCFIGVTNVWILWNEKFILSNKVSLGYLRIFFRALLVVKPLVLYFKHARIMWFSN